jgi:hypothetical protein
MKAYEKYFLWSLGALAVLYAVRLAFEAIAARIERSRVADKSAADELTPLTVVSDAPAGSNWGRQ